MRRAMSPTELLVLSSMPSRRWRSGPTCSGEQAARIEGGEQLLHAEQGVDFSGREPDAGEFVALNAGVDVVGARVAVADDGYLHAFLEITQVAV